MASQEIDDSEILSLVICGFALLFAVPFHIILIVVLVRYRKTDAFSFPFFRMLLSLSINDLIAALVSGISFLMLLLPPKIFLKYTSPWLRIAQDAFFTGGISSDCIILVAIGINRLLAYVFPLKSIWKPIHTKFAIILQWTYAIAFGMSSLPADMHAIYFLNETTGTLMEEFPETTGFQIRLLIALILMFISGLILIVIYCVCVGKLIHHKLTTTVQQDSASFAIEARLSFQGFFLSSSLVISAFAFGYAFPKTFMVSPLFLAFIFIVIVSNFVCGPFIAIGMSRVIRDHIKKLFKLGNNNVVPISAPLNPRANEPCEEDKL